MVITMKGEMIMKYGYARVSTRGQATHGNSLEEQVSRLKEEGCDSIVEEQYTGTTTNRPKFSELIDKLKKGDTIVVTKLDRFARSATEGSKVIKALQGRGVKIHVLNMGLIDDSNIGNLISTIVFAFAEFERNMIVERTQEGKARARTKAGFHEGRPKKFSKERVDNAIGLLLQGNSYKRVSDMTGISTATLTRAMRSYKAEQMK